MDIYKINKRFMMASRCVQVGQAIYHGLTALTNNHILDNTNKTNHDALAKSLATYSMNWKYGIPQHKESFISHIITQQFSCESVFEHVHEIMPNVRFEPHALIDSRFIKELPVLQIFYSYFHYNIDWLIATNDMRAANFYAQKQSNQDFWVNLKIMPFIDKALSVKQSISYKVVPHDEKAGMGMFDSATRGGTLGVVSYDSTGTNIQMTRDLITNENLINYNKIRLLSIENGMKQDNMSHDGAIINTLRKYRQIFNDLKPQDFNTIVKSHNDCQQALWDNIQLNPEYKRSVSFVFINHLKENNVSSEFQAFHDHFVSLLPDRLYNLDKKSDLLLLGKAAIIAYKKTVDPFVLQKLQYLNEIGNVKYTTNMIDLLAFLVKTGL